MLITYFANNWKYSNAPEGQRPFEKVVGLTKYGVAGSFGIGIYDCLLMSQTQTFWQCVNCMSYWMVPITTMCATFASVAYTVTKVRGGQDGYINYILASLATSGVFHQWHKKGVITYYFAVLLTGCSMVKKYGDMTGWNPLPLDVEMRTQHSSFPDYTLFKDPRGRRPWE